LPTAIGTCLGEESVLRLATRKAGKSASFRESRRCWQLAKTTENRHLKLPSSSPFRHFFTSLKNLHGTFIDA